MIHEVIEKWHLHMKGQLPGGLDELLDDDVVFISPSCSRLKKARKSPSCTCRLQVKHFLVRKNLQAHLPATINLSVTSKKF